MSYSVVLSTNAMSFLEHLPQKDNDRIIRKLNEICVEPFRFLVKLSGSRFWRLRVGDYRAIIDVIIIEHKIFVIRIGKRENVYD